MIFMKKFLVCALLTFFSTYAFSTIECGFKFKKNELQNYRYVIVPGILNEFVSYYMTEHRRFLMQLGVPKEQIHRVNLESFMMPDEAALVLEKAVAELPKDKAFVFLSHSKGALETLYFLQKKHSTINLKNALLIQGPLDGASITKLPDEKGFLGFLNFMVKRLVSTGFVSAYDKSYSSEHVREKLKGLESQIKLLNKIVFVESGTSYENLKWRFKPLGGQYKEYFGRAGDGILLEKDHIPYSLKDNKTICRKSYDIDHSGLVKAAPWNSLKVEKIKNFLERVFF